MSTPPTPTSAPSTPSRQPSRSWGIPKAIRRSTLFGGGSASKESSRPGTPAAGSSVDLVGESGGNGNGGNGNGGSKDAVKDAGTGGEDTGNAGKDVGNAGTGGKDASGTKDTPTPTKKDKDADDDGASIKSGKSSKGSIAGRFLSRSGSIGSLRSLGRRKTLDTSKQPPLDTSSGGLAPPPHAAVANMMVPSPIAESPNREAMETPPSFAYASAGAAGTGPSPLAHQTTESDRDSQPPEPASYQGSSSEGSPRDYVPPPLLDSSAGNPGAFTDESDMLPQPAMIVDPFGGVASRSRSRVDLSAGVPPLPEDDGAVAEEGKRDGREGRRGDGREGEGEMPNPHEARESSLPSPHEVGVSAPRGLEGDVSAGGPSLVSTEQDYGVQVERSGEGSVVYAESPSSHGGGFSVVGGERGVEGKGGEGEGYGYGTREGYGSRQGEGKDGEGERGIGKEPTLPAYEEGVNGGQWGDGTPLDNPFVDLQSRSQPAYQGQPPPSEPQSQSAYQLQVEPRSAYEARQQQPQSQSQGSPYQAQPEAQYPYEQQQPEEGPTRGHAPSPPVPQNTLANVPNVPPEWPREQPAASNPEWSESPTDEARMHNEPRERDLYDQSRGQGGYDQPRGQGGYEESRVPQGYDRDSLYVPPPSPPPPAPRVEMTRSVGGGGGKGGKGGLVMTQPQHPTTQVMPIETHRDDHPTILMPLPPFNSVVAAQPLVHPTSSRAQHAGYDTDETRPLLGGGSTKPATATYGIRPADSTDSAWVPTASSSTKAAGIYSLPRRYGSTTSFKNYDSSHAQPRGGVGAVLGVGEDYGPNVMPKLHDLGWVEYHLPDGTFYYVHPTLRVTTDVNLRNERLLDDVTTWLDANPPFGNSGVGAHPGYGATDDSFIGTGTGKPPSKVGNGVEVWLRDAKGVASATGSQRRERRRQTGVSDNGRYLRCWVDHHARTVVLEKPAGSAADRKGKRKLLKRGKDGKSEEDEEEDELDMGYRYWSFMEAHPAHTVLPMQSRDEALEVLTWAYTDRLLPSQKPVPPPFGPSECEELRNLIRSFPADGRDENGIQTRVVARVLLRVASWRQSHFRAHKPLPKDVKPVPPTSLVGKRASAVGNSVLRLVWDMFVVLVCLGLPYIFVERRNRDEEGWHGELRTGASGGSVFAVGVISCLVSAVILSASVTFISLPGMTGAARIAGFVAISCAVGSMFASTIAFIRFRNEFSGVVDRTSVNHRMVGGEGLVGISNKAVVNSLPLVFVAYSVIAFVVGLSIYSFRGTDLEGPSSSAPGDVGLGAWVFGQGAKWSALGLLGAAGGVVAMSWVVWKQ